MKATAFLVVLAAMASTLTAQNLVLPDNHHLMERADQLANSGDTTYWRTTAGRFQILYEASNFTGKSGVPGPVLVTHVKFRGEDGEPNLGGQVYSSVMVQLGSTSLTSATMTTSFGVLPGQNRDPLVTTMGPLGTTTVTVTPSVGSCPNNYCIDIDLVAIGAAFVFDPTGPQPNLLIDITMPTAPVNPLPMYLIPIQDTTAHGAGIRGKAVATSSPGAASGTADTTPAVVGLEIAGPGGYPIIIPARNEEYGAACGGACSTFYQTFDQGQPFDLTGIWLLPDNPVAPNFYTVIPNFPGVDLSQLNPVPDSTADEALVTKALGFTWAYPGGSTSTIKVSTNGHIWLDSTMTAPMYQTNKTDMLGAGTTNYTARYMPFWTDLHCGRNTVSNPAAGLHVKVVPESFPGAGDAVVYVTWNDVGLYRVDTLSTQPGHSSYAFQCVMHQATGIVEYRYGAMNAFASGLWTTSTSMHYSAIVGFTRGRISSTPLTPSQDPQSRDLSIEVPFSTSIEGTTGNAGVYAVAAPIGGGVGYMGRMFGGQSMTWNLSNIPAGTVFAMTLLDLGATQPGFQLPGIITAPGCMISTTLSPVFLPWELFLLPGSSATGINVLPVPHGWEGTDITVQGVGLDLSGTLGAPLIPWSTQAIRHTVGLD